MEERAQGVVLAALNSKYIHAALAPWCLASAVLAYTPHIIAHVVEGTVNEPPANISELILNHAPFAVGLSCYIWNIDKTLELAKLLKQKRPNLTIILGGPEVSVRAEQMLLSYSFIDYISCGEGEESLPLLLNAILKNEPLNISGICYRNNSKIINNPQKRLEKEPPCPYTEKYFEGLNGRIAYIETSRGCPYSCAFCLSGQDDILRHYSLNSAKENIIKLSNSGAHTIKFVDRTFNASFKHANEILRFIADSYGSAIPLGVCFHFELAGDILQEETFLILKEMPVGAVQLEIGIQSLNEKTLAAVRRKTDTKKLIANLKRLISYQNMHIHIDLIAGLPYEGIESFEESFNKAFSLKANMLQLGFLKLLHGTAMRQEPNIYPCEYSKAPPYEVLSTPSLCENEMAIIKRVEDSCDRLYNSARFLLTLEYVINASGETAFSLFSKIPLAQHKESLESYTLGVFEAFKKAANVNELFLRDAMVCDWLAFNSTGRLPKCLQITDARLKAAVKNLIKNKSTAPLPHIKRGVAILYGAKAVAYVDYIEKNSITKRYAVKLVEKYEL